MAKKERKQQTSKWVKQKLNGENRKLNIYEKTQWGGMTKHTSTEKHKGQRKHELQQILWQRTAHKEHRLTKIKQEA